VCGNSGGFAPFSPATLARRYTNAKYMRRYKRDLKPLLADGLVLRADRRDMLRRAAKQYRRSVPRGVP
jgi:Alpha/beta hydrolase domain